MVNVTVKREANDDLGTHYVIYIADLRAHIEGGKLAAEKIADRIRLGEELLSDILAVNIKRLHLKNMRTLEKSFDALEKEMQDLKANMTRATADNTTRKKSDDSGLFKESVDHPENFHKVKLRQMQPPPLKPSSDKNLLEDLLKKKIETKSSSFRPMAANGLQLKYHLSLSHAEELSKLIEEVRTKGFTRSSQLSHCIENTDLKYKYPNIAGRVTMENDNHRWGYDGGFPTNIYRAVCIELDLYNNGSNAKAVNFVSYHDQ